MKKKTIRWLRGTDLRSSMIANFSLHTVCDLFDAIVPHPAWVGLEKPTSSDDNSNPVVIRIQVDTIEQSTHDFIG